MQPKLVNKLAPNLVQPPDIEVNMSDSLLDTQMKLKEAQMKIDNLAEWVPVLWKDTLMCIS